MLDIFSQFLKFLKFDTVCIDNNVFRLHYKATLMILVMACTLVCSRQYIGDPIDCLSDGGIPGGIMDAYCWLHGTFSIPERWVGEQGVDVPHPGVAPGSKDGEEPVYHKYYQWVAYVLFFQAGLFYVPRFLWKTTEGGRMQMLVAGMFEPKLVVDKAARSEKIGTIVKYIQLNRGQHSFYFLKFFVCEVLNFVNVLGQLFFMDMFLGYEFSTYGLKVIEFTEMDENRPDPMAVVFPKVSKCSFHKYGPSGSIERHDGLCVLPLNIINEKIYIFLWFWFITVASITGIFLLYRLAVLFNSGIRTAMIQARTGRVGRDKIADILSDPGLNYFQQLGDFFVLYLIAKNMDEVATKELINELHSVLKPAYSNAPTLKASSKNNSAIE